MSNHLNHRIIFPDLICSYILQVRSKITYSKLKKIKRKIEKNFPNLFIDLDTSLIYKLNDEYSYRFRVEYENNDIVIYSVNREDLDFLDECYWYEFHNNTEFNNVKKILMSAQFY